MLKELEDRAAVHSIRLQTQLMLEDYISDRQDVEPRGRFGQIMFLLPYLQSISSSMIQQIQNAQICGVAEVDHLIQEMLLGCKQEVVETTEHEDQSTVYYWKACVLTLQLLVWLNVKHWLFYNIMFLLLS